MQINVSNFLYSHGSHYSSIDLAAQSKAFLEEMQAGLDHKPSSLMMIPSYVRTVTDCSEGKKVIAIDAGGTNLRIALIQFNSENRPSIIFSKKHPMPGTKGRITVNQFADKIVEYLKPVIKESDNIGLCFSFPAEILEDGDGLILGFNKEVLVDGARGCRLGKIINDALFRIGVPPKAITVVNDTTATLLGGIASFRYKKYSSYIGLILGTGTNTCYIDSVTLSSGRQEKMPINLESGGYVKLLQGDFDKIADEQSTNPGDHKLEKMISGAYFASMVYIAVMQACKEGLFSDDFEKAFIALKHTTLKQINEFCENPFGHNELASICLDNDRRTLYEILDSFYERSARIVIVNICGIITKNDTGKNPIKPVCVCVEGTLFHKSAILKSKINFYNEFFIKRTMGLYCEFTETDNATLIGAAVASSPTLRARS